MKGKVEEIKNTQQPDTLTELERVKMENFALKHNTLQQQIHGNMANRAAFIEHIEAAHPGHKWHEATGSLKWEDAP